MATYDQPITTYSDTSIRKQVISDVITIIDPSETPFISAIGGMDGAAGKFRFSPGKSTKVEWIEDSLPTLTTTLQTATIASNATSATVADASIFEPGYIFLIDAQKFWVSAVDTTNNTLTFASHGGTGASHATATTITIVSQARLEAADSSQVGLPSKTLGTNYTQIFHHEVKVSRTQQGYAQWGVSDTMEYEASKAIPHLNRLIEKHVLTSGTSAAGTGTTARVMGGLPYFVTTNSVSGQTLTKTAFENACASAFLDGGMGPWIAPLHPTNFAKVRAFYESSAYMNIYRDDSVVGMPPVTKIITPFGEVIPVLDRFAETGKIFLIDPQHAGMMTYDQFSREPLAKVGDYDREQVVGEFTFCLKAEAAHAILDGVS